MKIISIAAAMALAATPRMRCHAGGDPRTSARALERASSRATHAPTSASPRAGPELPELRQGDPADSLYRRAREALNRRNYTQAADLFKTGHGSLSEVAVGAVGDVLPRVLALPDGQRRPDARVAGRADRARKELP